MKKTKESKWVIILDLDGTLLTEDNISIHPKSYNVIQELIKQGHHCIIATGRSKEATIPIYNYLKLDSWTVCDAGANIVDFKNEENNISYYFDSIVLKKVFSDPWFRKRINSVCTSYNNSIYINESVYYIFEYVHIEFQKYYQIRTLDEIKELPLKSFFVDCTNNEYVEEVNEYLKQHEIFDPFITNVSDFTEKVTDKRLVEVNNIKTTKFTGAKKIAEILKIDFDNVIAFGDSPNDWSMLKGFKNSVAMKNAKDITKKKAKYVTKYTNNEGGVGIFLNDFFDLKML